MVITAQRTMGGVQSGEPFHLSATDSPANASGEFRGCILYGLESIGTDDLQEHRWHCGKVLTAEMPDKAWCGLCMTVKCPVRSNARTILFSMSAQPRFYRMGEKPSKEETATIF